VGTLLDHKKMTRGLLLVGLRLMKIRCLMFLVDVRNVAPRLSPDIKRNGNVIASLSFLPSSAGMH
jgi:hypothetical protein